MKRSMKWLYLLPVLVLAGIWLYPRSMQGAPEADKSTPPPAKVEGLPVRVHRVVPERLRDQIKVNGQVLADEATELRSELAGKITLIGFEEGARVTEGDVLIRIDDAELQAEHDRLEAEIALARETEQRQENLLAKGTTSRENYDRARSRRITFEAELRVVQARLAKTRILAPFSGVIGFRHVSEGAYVTPNDPIATLLAIDPVKLEFAIPEKYAGRVAPGALVSFTLQGRDEVFAGSVYAVEPRIDTRTRTLPIRARAENPDETILPGTFATVTLVFDEMPNALLVPTAALIPTGDGNRIYIAVDGIATAREVTLGIRTPEMVQVLAGIEAGDLVIRSGILQIREGIAIAITNEVGAP